MNNGTLWNTTNSTNWSNSTGANVTLFNATVFNVTVFNATMNNSLYVTIYNPVLNNITNSSMTLRTLDVFNEWHTIWSQWIDFLLV